MGGRCGWASSTSVSCNGLPQFLAGCLRRSSHLSLLEIRIGILVRSHTQWFVYHVFDFDMCSAILNMQFAILLKEYSMVIIFLFILKTTLRLSFISHYRKSKRSSKQEYGWEIVSSILTQVRPIQPVHMFISIAESCWLYLKRIILCFFTQCTTVMSDKGFFFIFLYTWFYLDFRGRNLDTENFLAYRAVSRSFLSMWPHLVIHVPGITESWRLSFL